MAKKLQILLAFVAGCNSDHVTGSGTVTSAGDAGDTDGGESWCEWHPADVADCWPMLPSVDPNPDIADLPIASPTSASFAILAGEIHVVADWSYYPDEPLDPEGSNDPEAEVRRFYRWDGVGWNVTGIEGSAFGIAPRLSVSAAGPLWAGGYLWQTSNGGIVRSSAPDGFPIFAQAAAHPEHSTSFAASRWGPNPDTLWSVSDDCVRQLWSRPDCGSDVYSLRMTVTADDRLYAVDGLPRFRVQRFDVDTVETVVVLDTPSDDDFGFGPGDIAVDGTGMIHTCYRRPAADWLTYGYGHTTADWQELSLDTQGATVGSECRLAASPDGSVVWLSWSRAVVRLRPEPPTPSDLPPDLFVFDLELSANGEPIILAVDENPMGTSPLVLGRREAGAWVLETIDDGQ